MNFIRESEEIDADGEISRGWGVLSNMIVTSVDGKGATG